jgi:hypothetical protein
MPTEIATKLKEFHKQLTQLRKDVRAQKTERIAKQKICAKAEEVGATWFDDFAHCLSEEGLPPDIVDRYSKGFGRLIKLSHPNNLRKSHLEVLNHLCRSFRDELILPLQQKPTQGWTVNQLGAILANLPDSAQTEYLQEAAACARRGYFRAAIVLGWCAAIDQIHRAIERNGFASFNVASSKMASQTKGRFRKFNQVQNVSSIGELREVFDTIVLWILEGMQLIDGNEHTRLHGCFNLRCQCAHPGNAPVTEYNLLSFFSDITEIVLKNPKLAS